MMPEGRDQRRGQPRNPRDACQQRKTEDQRERKAELARLVTLLLRQLVGENGDKDQIVDPEHQLEDDKRQESGPCRRISNPFHVVRLLEYKKPVAFREIKLFPPD